jgi:hypothetical protein
MSYNIVKKKCSAFFGIKNVLYLKKNVLFSGTNENKEHFQSDKKNIIKHHYGNGPEFVFFPVFPFRSREFGTENLQK